MLKCQFVNQIYAFLTKIFTVRELVSQTFRTLSVPLDMNNPVSKGYQVTVSTENLCRHRLLNPMVHMAGKVHCGTPVVLCRSWIPMIPSPPPERMLKQNITLFNIINNKCNNVF